MKTREKEINAKHFTKSELFKMSELKNTPKMSKIHFKRKPYSIGKFNIN